MNPSKPNVDSQETSPLKGLMGPCIRSAVFMGLLTGLAYPLLTTGLAQVLFPWQANGSTIEQQGKIVGSELIGQAFSTSRYFHPRPSATVAADPTDADKTISSPYNSAASGGSNQGPTNQALVEAARERVAEFRQANGMPADAGVPVDAVTASGSGLDPHVSVANAKLQANRVARARGLTDQQVLTLVDQFTEGRTLGLLGEPRVNVLRLNLALDALRSASEQTGSGASQQR